MGWHSGAKTTDIFAQGQYNYLDTHFLFAS